MLKKALEISGSVVIGMRVDYRDNYKLFQRDARAPSQLSRVEGFRMIAATTIPVTGKELHKGDSNRVDWWPRGN